MKLNDLTILAIIHLLVGGASFVWWRSKRKHKGQSACVGCPYAKSGCAKKDMDGH